MAIPVLRNYAEPTRAGPEDLEDQHGVADVDPELAPVSEVLGRLGVVAKHTPAGRDLDAPNEVEARHGLQLPGADVGNLRIDRDVGVVVKIDGDAARQQVQQVTHVACHEADRVVDAANRERSQHRGIGAVADGKLEVLERLSGRVSRDARPGFDGPGLVGTQPRVDLGDLLATHLDDLLAHPVVEAVPLTRGPHGEDHIGAPAVLHHVTHHRSLIAFDQLTRIVQHRNHRYRQSRAGAGLLDRSHEQPLR